jgi:hypothetical protein
MRGRTALIILAASIVAGAGIVVALLASDWRSDALRDRIDRTLSARFNADVAIEQLAVSGFPRLRLTGSGLTMRVRGRTDLPPFISIDRFWMDMQPLSVRRKHVETVHLDGLHIQVPPEAARKTLHGFGDPDAADSGPNPSHVMIEHLVSHDAELSFVPKPGHRPHVFEIHNLELEQLAFDRPVLFKAQLINPIPLGLIETTGSFGPWARENPADTPVGGRYVFSDADLSTIGGISGTLSSVGTFDGRLTSIEVAGTTKTPNFNLRLGGRPLPLETTFAATVDGTNGTTILKTVDAKLRHSSLKASGAVVNLPGPGRHDIKLQVTMPRGRIEDLLAIITSNAAADTTGNAVLRASVHLPPGHSSTLSRLSVNGTFGLTHATFADNVQTKLRELSRRSQGKSRDEMEGAIASDVSGGFTLDSGMLTMRDLAFDVPGAAVQLSGTCNLRSRALDLHGTLGMKASVSEAVGGVKSIFLKIVDPFFRHRGETVLPIKIGGTIESPDPKLELRRK